MAKNYKTILIPYETETEIKKSRFINMIFHVENEAEVEVILEEIKKKQFKANHICWAYVFNSSPKRQKASDDGEPSGTAGKPILEVINHHAVLDVLLVVVRYFGGIKLGAGGLIRAYGAGAADVISQCQTIKKQYSDPLEITITYTAYGSLSNRLSEKEIVPVKEVFSENVTLFFQIPVEKTQEFLGWIKNQTSGTAEVIQKKPLYVDILLK